MDESWKPIVIVANFDAKYASFLSAIVRVAVIGVDGRAFHDLEGNLIGPAQGLPGDVLCFLALSRSALEAHAIADRLWRVEFGLTDGLALEDHKRARNREAEVFAAIARRLSSQLRCSHAGKTRLMREVALLRRDHDNMQGAFASLEAYFHRVVRSERSLTMTLSPDPGLPALSLRPDDEIEQRLPEDSLGLSDIGICLRSAPVSGAGNLRVTLELLEDGEAVADWVIPAYQLAEGWLRLSLARALGPDPQTAVLRLVWEGESELRLMPSMPHPDPRFTPRFGAPMLALRLWKFVPGAQAALPVDGHPAQLAPMPDEWNIGLSALRRAQNASPEPGAVEFSDLRTGLFVRPKSDAVAAARIDGAGRPGMVHIFGGVKTEQEAGPEVEYAYALAPASARKRVASHLPQFDQGRVSDWLRLPPNEWRELHLFLDQPLAEPHDLYLLSRVAGKSAAPAPVEACFFRMIGKTAKVAAE